MGSTREKGKIPRSEWPKILARYNSGETIASIGRAYHCTAPAIRYIVKRSGSLKAEPNRVRAVEGSRSRQRALTASKDGGGPSPAAGKQPAGRQIFGDGLRGRISGDIASFLVALDQAVLDGSVETIVDLQEATDRLMRSTARARIELERMLSAHTETGRKRALRGKETSAYWPDA